MPKEYARTKLSKIRHPPVRIGKGLVGGRILGRVGKQTQFVAHGPDDFLPDLVLVLHLGEKVVIQVVNEPSVVIQLVLELTGGPSRMAEEAGDLNLGVLLTQGLGLFQVYPEVKLEGRGFAKPLPGGHDQFFPLHGTTLENRDVGEIQALELIVQVTEALSDGAVQDDPQGSVFIRMRGKKDHGLEEIGVPQTWMRQENAARQASGRLKSLG